MDYEINDESDFFPLGLVALKPHVLSYPQTVTVSKTRIHLVHSIAKII